MSDVMDTTPWSVKAAPLGRRAIFALGAGSVIASFYIGTGDVSIATSMGAQFGFSLWWTYFVLGIAGWSLVDMSVRYFLRFGKSPMSIFFFAQKMIWARNLKILHKYAKNKKNR